MLAQPLALFGSCVEMGEGVRGVGGMEGGREGEGFNVSIPTHEICS